MADGTQAQLRPVVTRAEARARGLNRFFTGEPCINRHASERYISTGGCVACYQAHSSRRHAAEMARALAERARTQAPGPEELPKNRAARLNKERNARYREAHPSVVLESQLKHKKNHPERRGAVQAKYHWANRSHICARKSVYNQRDEVKAAARERERRERETLMGCLNGRMSTRVRSALKSGKGGKNWFALVGYSVDQLRSHIERQFARGMSWSNMADWHIDHILPLSSFKYASADDPEFKAAWALTNLRPLWAQQNISKSNKRELLL